jgi:hypothetical protein
MAFSTEEQKRRWPPGILSGGQIGTYSLSEPQAGSEFGAGQCGKAGGHRRRDGGHRQGEEMSASGCASKCVASSASRSVIWRLSPTMMPTAARVVAANAAVTGAGAVSCSARCAAPPRSPEHGRRYGQRDSLARATALGTLSVGTSACAFGQPLQQSEQLQVGDVLDDDVVRDVWNVFVGADFRLLHRGAEPFCRRQGAAPRLVGLIVEVQQGQN